MAASIIAGAGLERYYAMRTQPAPRPGGGQAAWADAPVETTDGGLLEVRLHVGGLTCAACAWVTERVVLALPGVVEARVSPATGRARVSWDPSQVDLDAICGRIAAIGYRPRGVAAAAAPDRDLLLRFGVAAFCGMNVMLLSAGLYAGWFSGIAPREAALLRWTALAIATPAALWSAAPLWRGAGLALVGGAISVDLPVAVGIGAMYTHGVWATMQGQDGWLDSMTMLIALLLGGRVLEQGGRRRAVEAAQALAGTTPAIARRATGSGVERVPASQLVVGDTLLAALGEQIAADGLVRSGHARVQMALLTGESEARSVAPGDRVVAGAIVDDGFVEVEVEAVGQDTLVARMAAELERAADRPAAPGLADRMAPAFTVGTLILGGLALALRGQSEAIAVLVVACPCALALAAPLSTAAGLGGAARRGLLVRSGDALRRLASIDVVVFDKTGTLTMGQPVVLDADPAVLRIAAALARKSAHPVSRALVAAASARGVALADAVDVVETPGVGLDGFVDGVPWSLRRGESGIVVEGLGAITMRDAPRPDAAVTVAALRALGLRVALLSGDGLAVAQTIASVAGVDEVIAPASPDDKVAWIRARRAEGHRVLFVGDGVNDGPALAEATVGIAMADGAASSVLVADAVLVGEGLAPVLAGLKVAGAADRATRAGVARALIYNALAVTAAFAGFVNPLVAAVLMPISSLTAILGARKVGA